MGSLKINCPKCAKCKKHGMKFYPRRSSVVLGLLVFVAVVFGLSSNPTAISATFDRELKRHFPNRVDIAGIDKTVLLRELCGNTATCPVTATDLLGDSVDPRFYGKNRFESVVKKIKE